MDTEQQVRLNFLEEAEEYFEQLETILLNLATAEDRPQQLDAALRAAHSIKGSAGMMGFMPLSQVAHHLEDSFKILRARQIEIDTGLETLLLQGIDCLRAVKHCHYEEIPVDDAWMNERATPIFDQLRDRLGSVTEADENTLLAANEDIDITTVMFTSGVDGALTEFEALRPTLSGEELRQSLIQASTKMMEFGLIGEVDPFVALCGSIQAEASTANLSQINHIADEALELWQRTSALVELGRVEQLPTALEWSIANTAAIATDELAAPTDEPAAPAVVPEIDANDLSSLQASLTALEGIDLSAMAPAIPAVEPDAAASDASIEDAATTPDATSDSNIAPVDDAPDVTTASFDLTDLAQLQTAMSNISLPDIPEPEAIPAPAAPTAPAVKPPTPVKLPTPAKTQRPAAAKTASDANIRVPVEQLRQINSLFSALILDRNSINLRLEQFQDLMGLLRQRMDDLEGFNLELRRWYDQASMEDLVPAANGASVPVGMGLPSPSQSSDSGFDALEMDQYSELHLLAQEQMETIVKLQEVIGDINLTNQEMQQANNSLNLTSRNLQTRITRTQMRPFEDIVGRFPRVMRDYAVKYGKQVKLAIEGENTLFERYALDILTDPINHLLRNAFDHGIETPEVREANGKPSEGTITIRASQRGNRAIVTMSDDGGGINLDKIRNKIRQYGIPEAQIQEFSEQKLLDMIFDAGFSTADKVTELSGRGVGMDVVKSNLKKVQGDISVTTELGKGSTFTISIPLSLSIFRVMLLETSGFTFAIPLDVVKEILPLASIDIQSEADGASIVWQDSTIPLHNPEQHWNFAPGTKQTEMSGNPMINHPLVVVVGSGTQAYGLQVKRFWAEQEVAIRPVASPLALPEGFSGVTTLGDGRVVPLLDPMAVLDLHESITTRPSDETASPDSADRDAGMDDSPTASSADDNVTVLVVDDSIHARRYLALSLEKAGYLVEQARDGQEAVDQLLGGLRVQAVICDVEMPRLDGYGVLSEIKTRSEFRELPIAMLTSRSSEKHRKLAMNLGATAYFSKPYNEQELLQTLGALV
ncbi:hybrid sensor histidine kinase/response regulator [filamentous cyanobacterium LEGE 11480]|uniref:histidine kinase n=1 Tax=Romeriopsis navalis LEGE 11480 TaxID=2777977 RepID=A0A928VI89_9CYAN|nr:hybrid sensor histidine kinase/response regulator [Romeriopsis navalis]MBE9029098.1 hybrid sensor histidine kinase/response regulator [Romeriopsis navalis LEGE 11480]